MKISIPKPCHENWNEMLPDKSGRFCLSCNKCVTDFTKLSDLEILKLIQKPDQCGKFSKWQLERINLKLRQQNQFQFPRIFRYSTFMIGLGLSGSLVAQEKEKIEIVENSNVSILETLKSKKIIAGKITDADGFPIYSAKIEFPNGQFDFTDEEGSFKIELIDLIENNFQVIITDSFGQEYYKNIDVYTNDYVELTCEGSVIGEVSIVRERNFAGKTLRTLAWPFRQIGKLF